MEQNCPKIMQRRNWQELPERYHPVTPTFRRKNLHTLSLISSANQMVVNYPPINEPSFYGPFYGQFAQLVETMIH
jgi:hypothetical protein